ncbi:MAG: hypothetical protein WAW37_06470, partial [Syntrophobacteraceae bacterium]
STLTFFVRYLVFKEQAPRTHLSRDFLVYCNHHGLSTAFFPRAKTNHFSAQPCKNTPSSENVKPKSEA